MTYQCVLSAHSQHPPSDSNGYISVASADYRFSSFVRNFLNAESETLQAMKIMIPGAGAGAVISACVLEATGIEHAGILVAAAAFASSTFSRIWGINKEDTGIFFGAMAGIAVNAATAGMWGTAVIGGGTVIGGACFAIKTLSLSKPEAKSMMKWGCLGTALTLITPALGRAAAIEKLAHFALSFSITATRSQRTWLSRYVTENDMLQSRAVTVTTRTMAVSTALNLGAEYVTGSPLVSLVNFVAFNTLVTAILIWRCYHPHSPRET